MRARWDCPIFLEHDWTIRVLFKGCTNSEDGNVEKSITFVMSTFMVGRDCSINYPLDPFYKDILP